MIVKKVARNTRGPYVLRTDREQPATRRVRISNCAMEDPALAQLEDIEHELCHAMGLGDHQRLSVVHLDTGHVHVHLAINKVYPLSHNNVELIRNHF